MNILSIPRCIETFDLNWDNDFTERVSFIGEDSGTCDTMLSVCDDICLFSSSNSIDRPISTISESSMSDDRDGDLATINVYTTFIHIDNHLFT